MAQPVERQTSAKVLISRVTSSSLESGSVLTAQSLEPASGFVSPSLSAPAPLTLCVCLSLSKINIKKNFKNTSCNFSLQAVLWRCPPPPNPG